MTKDNIIKMFWQGKLKKSLWAIALLIICTVIALPYAVRYGVSSYLLENGAKSVTISDLGINLFTGKVHINGISIEDSKRPLLASDNFAVDLDLISIFKKEITIETANVENLILRIKQLENGNWQIASISTAGDQDNIEKEIEDGATLKEDTKWIFGAKEVVLKNCVVELETAKSSTKVEIEQADLHNFATKDGPISSDFSFLGKVDGAAVEIKLNQISLENMLFTGDIKISKYSLTNLSRLLADVLTLKSGDLSIDGNFKLDIAEQLQVEYTGQISSENLDLTVTPDNFKVKSFIWDGTANYSPDSEHFLTGLTGKSAISIDGLAVDLQQNDPMKIAISKGEIAEIILGKDDATIGNVKLVSSKFQLLSSANPIDLEIPAVNASGLKTDGVSGALKDINITDIKLKTSNNSEPINLKISDTKIKGILASKESSSIANIALAGTSFAMPESATPIDLNIKSTSITNTKIIGSKNSVENAVIAGIQFKTSNNNEPINLNINETKIKKILNSEESSSIGNILLAGTSLIMPEGAAPIDLNIKSTSITNTKVIDGKNTVESASISGTKLKYAAKSMPLDITLSKADILGIANSKTGNNISNIKLTGTSVYSPLRKMMVTKLADLSISKLSVAENSDLTISDTQIKNWDIFPDSEGDGHSGKLAKVGMDKFSLTKAKGLSLKTLQLTQMDLWLVRDKSGSFNWGEKIASLSDQKVATDNKKDIAKSKNKEKDAPLAFNIGEFKLTGDNTINYQDYTLAVPFKSASTISKFVLKDLSSSASSKGTIELEGLLEQRAPITLTGDLGGLAGESKDGKSTTFIDIKYKLKNYPIRNLSPYAVQNVGSALDSGRMKIEGNFKLDTGVVDSENELFFNKLETKSIDAELAKKVDGKLPMPLGAALALLRDNEENIQLAMPISGPVDGLNFDATDAIITALGKAVIPAASSYLVYMLGPYAALAYVGLKVGQNLLEVSLPPVDFAPQQIELTVDNKKYLERVGILLNDGKTTADLQICPIVVLTHEFGEESKPEEELSAEELTEIDQLGQSRADNIRSYLQNEYEIDPNRLLLCITKIQKDKTSKVVLHLDTE